MKKLIFLFAFVFSIGIYAQKSFDKKVVEAACGSCIFKDKSQKGCYMAVKIDGKVYPVVGIDEKQFGDAHDEMGYCKTMRKAEVSGKIKGKKFYATSFRYL